MAAHIGEKFEAPSRAALARLAVLTIYRSPAAFRRAREPPRVSQKFASFAKTEGHRPLCRLLLAERGI